MCGRKPIYIQSLFCYGCWNTAPIQEASPKAGPHIYLWRLHTEQKETFLSKITALFVSFLFSCKLCYLPYFSSSVVLLLYGGDPKNSSRKLWCKSYRDSDLYLSLVIGGGWLLRDVKFLPITRSLTTSTYSVVKKQSWLCCTTSDFLQP